MEQPRYQATNPELLKTDLLTDAYTVNGIPVCALCKQALAGVLTLQTKDRDPESPLSLASPRTPT